MNKLTLFGELSLIDFEQFNENAYLCFFIKSKTGIRISGSVNSEIIELVTEKENVSITEQFEAILTDWAKGLSVTGNFDNN